MEYTTLAAVDLGSNSFHLAIGRVVDDQLYPLDSIKETVRLGAGLGPDKRLDAATQERALAALRRFSERLAGMPPESVRVVGTNTLRVAKNSREFLAVAQKATRLPDRDHLRPRGGAPHLLGRGALHSAHRPQPAGLRHRRGLDRIHHRRALEAQGDGQPVHGLRELDAPLLPRRAHRQEVDEGRRARRARTGADDRRALREDGLEGGGGLLRQRAQHLGGHRRLRSGRARHHRRRSRLAARGGPGGRAISASSRCPGCARSGCRSSRAASRS